MGIQIEAKYAGQCPECEEEFDVGEDIYYQKRPKPKKSIVCVNFKCFEDQGGKLDKPPEKLSEEEYLFVLPKLGDNAKDMSLLGIPDILDQIIILAHDKVKRLMPNLSENSNTFGQVRNAFITHYKDIYLARYGTKKT